MTLFQTSFSLINSKYSATLTHHAHQLNEGDQKEVTPDPGVSDGKATAYILG